jgi:hypothetical protein
MLETGTSGSVGAPLDKPGGATRQSGRRVVVRFGLGQGQKAASANPGQKQKPQQFQLAIN